MHSIQHFLPAAKSMRRAALAGLVVAALFACSAKVNQSQVVHRNGLVYLKGTEKPFSGYVAGKAREGYRRKNFAFIKHYKHGRLNGVSKFFYNNGKLESTEPYENGELNGIVTRYYENGQMKARFSIKKGMRGGRTAEFFWDENGKLIKG
jgi:MORN repeat variant